MDSRIRRALKFAKTFVGRRYKWWTPQVDMTSDQAPFWASNDLIPQKIDAMSCTGLLNLIMRYLKKPVPGTEKVGYRYPGGTWIWFHTLKRQGVLHKFDPSKRYPKGTLLLRDYRSDQDQGHAAIIYKSDKLNVFQSLIIHSYSETGYTSKGGYSDPGVTIQPLGYSHFAFDPKGYYTHVCYPKDWLSV